MHGHVCLPLKWVGGLLNKVSISLSDVFYLLHQVVLCVWLNVRVKDFVIRVKTYVRVQRMDCTPLCKCVDCFNMGDYKLDKRGTVVCLHPKSSCFVSYLMLCLLKFRNLEHKKSVRVYYWVPNKCPHQHINFSIRKWIIRVEVISNLLFLHYFQLII